jgi:hypothetical protein
MLDIQVFDKVIQIATLNEKREVARRNLSSMIIGWE